MPWRFCTVDDMVRLRDMEALREHGAVSIIP